MAASPHHQREPKKLASTRQRCILEADLLTYQALQACSKASLRVRASKQRRLRQQMPQANWMTVDITFDILSRRGLL
jgi:hypothetical protein